MQWRVQTDPSHKTKLCPLTQKPGLDIQNVLCSLKNALQRCVTKAFLSACMGSEDINVESDGISKTTRRKSAANGEHPEAHKEKAGAGGITWRTQPCGVFRHVQNDAPQYGKWESNPANNKQASCKQGSGSVSNTLRAFGFWSESGFCTQFPRNSSHS